MPSEEARHRRERAPPVSGSGPPSRTRVVRSRSVAVRAEIALESLSKLPARPALSVDQRPHGGDRQLADVRAEFTAGRGGHQRLHPIHQAAGAVEPVHLERVDVCGAALGVEGHAVGVRAGEDQAGHDGLSVRAECLDRGRVDVHAQGHAAAGRLHRRGRAAREVLREVAQARCRAVHEQLLRLGVVSDCRVLVVVGPEPEADLRRGAEGDLGLDLVGDPPDSRERVRGGGVDGEVLAGRGGRAQGRQLPDRALRQAYAVGGVREGQFAGVLSWPFQPPVGPLKG